MSILRHWFSERLYIETVLGDGYNDASIGTLNHAVAYIGVESEENENFFGKTEEYLNLLLYLYSLQTGQPWIKFQNVGYNIASYSQLGTIDPGFPGFRYIEYIGESLERHIEYLQKLSGLFHQLELHYENIMISPSGLSLKFFYDAIMSNHRKELDLAVVHFIIAAEALTIIGEGSKRQNVSKRIAVLTSESSTEYSEIYRKMKELYDVRSGIVHGGGKKATPEHVGDLFSYLRKAVLIRLSLRHLSKRELISKLDAISVDWNKKKDLTSMQAFEVEGVKKSTHPHAHKKVWKKFTC